MANTRAKTPWAALVVLLLAFALPLASTTAWGTRPTAADGSAVTLADPPADGDQADQKGQDRQQSDKQSDNSKADADMDSGQESGQKKTDPDPDKDTDPEKPAEPKDDPAAAAADDSEGRYIRVRRDEQGHPLSMDTAVVSFQKEGDLVVDLIGAVHIADQSYYKELNELFATYDVLLYELVAPEGTRITPDTPRGSSPISAIQRGMKNVLGLHFQLDCVDYTKDNFVHADMTPTEFSKSMRDRGESFFQILVRAMRESLKMQAKGKANVSDIDILVALISKDRSVKLKRLMAEQFEDLENQINVFNGPDGSTLITERNKKALSVLDEQIAAGKKKIGIFYGAGHLPDMSQRLIDDHQMQRTGQRWLTAWDLQ